MNLLAGVIFIVAAIPAFVVGYLLHNKQRLGLLSNVDLALVADAAALGRFTGRAMYFIGAVIAGVGLYVASFAHSKTGIVYAVLFMTIAINALIGWMMVGMKRYMKPG